MSLFSKRKPFPLTDEEVMGVASLINRSGVDVNVWNLNGDWKIWNGWKQ